MIREFVWLEGPRYVNLHFGGRVFVSRGDSLLGWISGSGAVAIIDRGRVL